ncbi:predicted protein [Phaeodactylum tricornutum CCAP 1055/1]|uniref:Uncharacterized protein n=2 Tax=Phaeodactylum tricornutum TaxID=2850 RepID=B7G1Q1_PHATC|nr:predicted protein [Phaeodactylum tricornutum CCAP 1055/1]EEC47546.1 predicted protein [Phaeodactylum tricornutum CCAP 1055/1]|eukprot:XP_002180894.1 predicted protein [Phaeodactylum tricornutum CCAP 1055/1]
MGIRLVERILWKTPGDQTWMASRKKTMERTLVERSIPMTRSPGPWQPLSQPSRDPNHETSPLTMSVPLKIPHESRVSYVGRLVEAHVLPNEWHPIAAEAIVLPESSVVSLEPGGGTCVTATSTSAPAVPWKADI